MRIGIDVSAAGKNQAGIGHYASCLANALRDIDSQNQYFFFSHVSSRLHRLLWFHFVLPLQLIHNDIDLFHGTNFMSPPLTTVPAVLTIHDLSFLLYPETQTLVHKLYRKLLPIAVRRARKIIAPTQVVKDEVVKYFGVPTGKVVVIHEGVSLQFQPGQTNNLPGMPDRYILFVGTLEPRKNLIRLFEAYHAIKGKLGEIKLVIVGKKGWLFKGIFAKIEELGLANDVVFAGYVADEDLPSIYGHAQAFIFPSLYEGFGLPILEAMACGVPVVTSNVSSMPEVAGDAAVLVDPLSVEKIAQGILTAIEQREKWRMKGLVRAKQFSWEKCAQETLAVYRSAMASQERRER